MAQNRQMSPFTDDRSPFDRLPGEPARAYHAFCHYRDAGSTRSLDRSWREHHAKCLGTVQPATRRRPMSWGDWSARWGWVERAGSYDAHLDRQKRTAFEAEQVEAARRHARVLQAAISAATIPLRVALETAATPDGIETLRSAALANVSGLRLAVSEARLSAASLPSLVQAERLTLGMATEHHQLTNAPTFDPVAARIVNDPAATELAVQLLTLIADKQLATPLVVE
jgi:hypothetical protein